MKYLVNLVVLFEVFFVLITAINTGIPAHDSGGFLYDGRMVLEGKIPYRDFWDHKPPVIFYLNALAEKLSPKNLWGLWFIEGVSLCLVYLLMHAILRKRFGIIESLFGLTCFSLLIIPLLQGGNATEEFGLLFQVLLVGVFAINWSFLMGIIAAALFLTKPSLVGLFIAIWIYQWFVEKNHHLKYYFGMLLGFVVTNALVLLYFWLNHALPQLVDQVFVFNSIYVSASLANRLSTLVYGLTILGASLKIFLIGLGLALVIKKPKLYPIAKLAIIWLVIDLCLASWTGRTYNHYFLGVGIPLVIILAQMAFWLKLIIKKPVLRLVVLILVLFVGYYKEIIFQAQVFYDRRPFNTHLQFRGFLYNNFAEHADTLETIKKYSSANDQILIWGSESGLLVLSDRDSASRYFYQQRLFYPGYNQDGRHTVDFVSEIKLTRPKLIIDASKSAYDVYLKNAQTLPSLDKHGMDTWLSSAPKQSVQALGDFETFLLTNYHVLSRTYDNKWVIYLRNDNLM